MDKVEKTTVNRVYIRNAEVGHWFPHQIKQILMLLFGHDNIAIEECHMNDCLCFVYGDNWLDSDVLEMARCVDDKVRELNNLRTNLKILGA